jgi:hypothetical protein
MMGPSLRKQQAPKTQRDRALIRDNGPVIDHLHMLVVLSSSRSTLENKKSLEKVQGVPKAPTKDQRHVSNPHEGARCRRSRYRGIPVHLLLGLFNGPTSAQG